MATFPPIQFKRSMNPGAVPTTADLLVGEIAINLVDRIIYTKDDSDNIIAIGMDPDYDSDIAQLRHDMAAKDSDQTIASLSDVILTDSENGAYILEHGFVLAYDSDQGLFKPVRVSSSVDTLTDVSFKDSDNGAYILEHGVFLSYDSDTGKWRPQLLAEAKSRISELLDIEWTDSDGTPLLQHGFVLAYDSDSDVWKPTRIAANPSMNDLSDVVALAPEHNQILSWDSDNNYYRLLDLSAAQDQALFEVESFVVTSPSANTFNLTYVPKGSVNMFRNGVTLPATAHSTSGSIVTYDQTGNLNSPLDSDDVITISYLRGVVSYGLYSTLQEMTDVSVDGLQHGYVLAWDSDSDMWKPAAGGAGGGTTTINEGDTTIINAVSKSEVISLANSHHITSGRGWIVDGEIFISGRTYENGFYGNNLTSLFTGSSGVDVFESLAISPTEEVGGWKQVHFGQAQIWAISSEGKLFIAGNNGNGSLGVAGGGMIWPLQPHPTLNAPGVEVLDVWTVDSRTSYINAGPRWESAWVSVNDNGTFKTYSFGNNDTCILANNTFETEQFTPYQHTMLDGVRTKKVIMNIGFGVQVLMYDGTVWYAGTGYDGVDGLGGAYSGGYNTTLEQCKEDAVTFLTNVTDIASSGGGFDSDAPTCYALKADGSVWSVGENPAWLGQGPTPTIDAYYHQMYKSPGVLLSDAETLHIHGKLVMIKLTTGLSVVYGKNYDCIWANGWPRDTSRSDGYAYAGRANVEKVHIYGTHKDGAAVYVLNDGTHISAGSNQNWLCGWGDFSKADKVNGDVLPGFNSTNKLVGIRNNLGTDVDVTNIDAFGVIALSTQNKLYVWGDVTGKALTLNSNLDVYKTPTRIRSY